MAKFNVHWVEMCNIEIEAQSEIKAIELWKMGQYDEDAVSRDLLDEPEIFLDIDS